MSSFVIRPNGLLVSEGGTSNPSEVYIAIQCYIADYNSISSGIIEDIAADYDCSVFWFDD